MKKRYIVIGSILLLGLVMVIASQTLLRDSNSEKTVAYRTEKAPLETRFPDAPDFTECYWKADTIGQTYFGPTNYWMRGFICLEGNALQKILADYEWTVKSIDFPNGVSPAVTGRKNFDWHFNKDFELLLIRYSFVGHIYLDTANGIIYFDVENM